MTFNYLTANSTKFAHCRLKHLKSYRVFQFRFFLLSVLDATSPLTRPQLPGMFNYITKNFSFGSLILVLGCRHYIHQQLVDMGLRKKPGPDEAQIFCPNFFFIFALYQSLVIFYDLLILCVHPHQVLVVNSVR